MASGGNRLDVFVNWTVFIVRSRTLAWIITLLVTVPTVWLFGPVISYIYEEWINP